MHYPFLEDPPEGTQALSLLARAGIVPDVPVLAIAERSAWSNYAEQLHLDPTCSRSAPKQLRMISVSRQELEQVDLDDGYRSCSCMLTHTDLGGWLALRRELVLALFILESIEESKPLADMDGDEPWRVDRNAEELGVLRLFQYGLTHPSDADPRAHLARIGPVAREAATAVEVALDEIAAAVPQTCTAANAKHLRRWVVELRDLKPYPRAMRGTAHQAYRAVGRGGLLGSAPHGSSTLAAVLAPTALLGSYGEATDLGPAGPDESASTVFDAYAAFNDVVTELRRSSTSPTEATKAALAAVSR